MTENHKYKKTIRACFVSYIVQAIVNNFIPLLFIMFGTRYGISISKITLLITFNFLFQLMVDVLSIGFVDKIGYRATIIMAHIFAALGFVMLAFLPDIMPDPFVGLLFAVFVYALGGGLLEVVVSPIVEACPSDHKASTMSLLHSFYCWGQLGVVLLSTVFFYFFGIENWKILALIWALVPFFNMFSFFKAPMASLLKEEKGMSIKELFTSKVFIFMLVMMLCSGASELAMSQWASAFAEKGLNISKTLGDLTGPMFFALLMGISRVIYSKLGNKINLERFMLFCSLLCIASYLLAGLSHIPALSLMGCGICGFSVGIMWPGTFSLSAEILPRGGTMMFAFLAFAGDIGCSGGPTLVGFMVDALGKDMKKGILFAAVFPLVLVVFLLFYMSHKKKNNMKAHV